MRSQRLLRLPSTQSLCLFCACRLNGELAASLPAATSRPNRLVTSRRALNTSRPSNQSAEPAQAPAGNSSEQSQGGSESLQEDLYAGLSPAERLAKEQRVRERAVREAARQEVAAAEAARQEAARQDIASQEKAREEAAWQGATRRDAASQSTARGAFEIRRHETKSLQGHDRRREIGSEVRKIEVERSERSAAVSSSNAGLMGRNSGAARKHAVPITAPDRQRAGGRQQNSFRLSLRDGQDRVQRPTPSPAPTAVPRPTPGASVSRDQTSPAQTSPASDSNAQANSWQHLRANAPAKQLANQTTDQKSRLEEDFYSKTRSQRPVRTAEHNHDDNEAIEKSFNAHRAGRRLSFAQMRARAQAQPAYSNPDLQALGFDQPSQEKSKQQCGRCLEYGHVARDCPKLVRKFQSGPIHRPNLGESGGEGISPPPPVSSAGNEVGPPRKTPAADSSSFTPFAGSPASQTSPREPNRLFNPFEETSTHRASNGSYNPFDEPSTHRTSTRQSQPGLEPSSTEARRGRESSRSEVASDEPAQARRGKASFWAQEPVDEPAPARRGRASFWAEAADEEVGSYHRADRRSVRKGGRRDLEEEEDDERMAMREERVARKAARKAEKERSKREAMHGQLDAQGSQVHLPEFVSVSYLAQLLGIRYEAFVDRLEDFGYDDIFPGKVLNSETSGMIAMEYNFEPIFESTSDAGAEELERNLTALPPVEDDSILPIRPPVVTIMGHVDHGKTTILDYLRKSSVAAGEAGGITQHIGAFSVPLAASGKTITFLDTPGHAAFLDMRQRGANVTDIVILVVAADDSVKPQTLEALRHARAANVPIIVALNKVDKEEADVQRVKNDLARHGIEIEDFGGDTPVVPVSGKTGQGLHDLEEAVVTLSEILDHRAEDTGVVEGWVLEATTKKAGRVATVLVRRGTLTSGAIIVAGNTWARVRTLRNEAGEVIESAGPGMPVEVDGWRDQPVAGDEVLQAPTEQKATSVVEFREEKAEREKTAQDMEAINEARRLGQERKASEEDALEVGAQQSQESTQQASSGQIEVPFIVKADVSGSMEAVAAYVLSVATPMITPRILASHVGGVHESDLDLASTAKAHIIAFNLPADEPMKGRAEALGVRVIESDIIYRIVEEVQSLLEDRLPPVISQRVLGEAEIGTVFEIGIGGRKKMKIAGCKVRNGVVGKGSRVRVSRGSEKIYDGTVSSLRNVKKDVQEMRKGTECGMGFEAWTDFEAGDQIQTYEEISEKRKLRG